MLGVYYILNEFIYAPMHSVTPAHAFSACFLSEIAMGLGGKGT
jgi:hypothetical protein